MLTSYISIEFFVPRVNKFIYQIDVYKIIWWNYKEVTTSNYIFEGRLYDSTQWKISIKQNGIERVPKNNFLSPLLPSTQKSISGFWGPKELKFFLWIDTNLTWKLSNFSQKKEKKFTAKNGRSPSVFNISSWE